MNHYKDTFKSAYGGTQLKIPISFNEVVTKVLVDRKKTPFQYDPIKYLDVINDTLPKFIYVTVDLPPKFKNYTISVYYELHKS